MKNRSHSIRTGNTLEFYPEEWQSRKRFPFHVSMQILIPPKWTLENHDIEGSCRIKQVFYFLRIFPLTCIPYRSITHNSSCVINLHQEKKRKTLLTEHKLIFFVCVCLNEIVTFRFPSVFNIEVLFKFLAIFITSFIGWKRLPSLCLSKLHPRESKITLKIRAANTFTHKSSNNSFKELDF